MTTTTNPQPAGGLGPAERLAALLRDMPDPTAAGGNARRLEEQLAAAFRSRYAVAVSSGTAALHTALAGYGIGPGDEVLVPGATVVMTVAAVLMTGATPVLVDSTPGLDLDFDDLAAKTTTRSRAIIPVHLAGRPCDLTRLAEFAAGAGLRVIEDACQAQGSRLDGRLLGTFGDAGCFSLKDGKIAWSGEGGYIVTDDGDFAARARSFATHGFLPAPGRPAGSRLGHNYRLAEPLAVIASANLERFDDLLEQRRQQTLLLTRLVADAPGLQTVQPGPREQWNHYGPLFRLTLARPRDFCRRLADLGVANSTGTYGLTTADRLPALADHRLPPCPTARQNCDVTLAVVVHGGHSDEQLRAMARTINEEAHRWPTT
ncbi:DegT/DnrJ/EryC1/StrS family aminotransferase [Kitasatospora sp. NPDC086791]|uniref:DegT/DnrJ/EryC1/StrS family aminotransferase n=1 Tax=Kitasatospora sp. NPDC086791 TaxID=3155178 RepID=UPI0034223E85